MDSEPGPATTLPTPPSSAVVSAVAAAEGVDETALPPLFHAIDPDALDSLFHQDCTTDARPRTSGTVEFRYAGYVVSVSTAGDVDLSVPSGR